MPVEQIEDLRRSQGDMQKDLASVSRTMAALTERISRKADREELGEFKEAIFERIRIEVAEALATNDKRTLEYLKQFGHDIAKTIEAEVKRQLVSRDETEKAIVAARKQARDEALKEAEEKHRDVRLSPRATAFAILSAMLVGALFSQWVIPLILKELAKRAVGL